VRAVIADCNGHPRSLEKSLRDPSDLQRGWSQQVPIEPLPPYSQLIDQLAKAVMPIYKRAIMACPSIDEMVSPSLLSDSVGFGRLPHNGVGVLTYSSYTASGLYINSKHEIEGIPVLSPLTLRVILRTNPRWTLAKSIHALLDHPANQQQQPGPTGLPGSGSDPADDTL